MTLSTNTALPPNAAANDTLMYHISRTFFELLPIFERHMGMTRARWQLLSALYRQDTISQAQLAQQLKVDAAAVTRQVKQLEEEGLVSRRADPQDNRFTLVELSITGRQLVEGLRERRDTLEIIISEGLSAEEIDMLKRGLSRVRANIQAVGETV